MTASKVRFLIRMDAGASAERVLRRLATESPFCDDPAPVRIERGGRMLLFALTRDRSPSERLVRFQSHLNRVAELYQRECPDPGLTVEAGFLAVGSGGTNGGLVLIACAPDAPGAIRTAGGQHVREIAAWNPAEGRLVRRSFREEEAEDERVAGFLTAAYHSECSGAAERGGAAPADSCA